MDVVFGPLFASKYDRYILMAVFLVCGSVTPVLASAMTTGYFYYTEKLTMEFQRPWFLTWGIFLGSSIFSFPIFIRRQAFATQSYPNGVTWTLFRDCAIPGLCQTISATLNYYAICYLPAALWQSVHSFSLIFSTLIKGANTDGRSLLVDWTALLIVLLGIATSGFAVMAREGYLLKSGSTPFFAIVLMILSQAINAGKNYFEERIIHSTKVSSYVVFSLQGIWGLIICSLVVLPLVSVTEPSSGIIAFEDSLESFSLLFSSLSVFLLYLFFIIFNSLFNIASVTMVGVYDSVKLQIVGTILPLTVWIISVVIYYSSSEDYVGEPIDFNTIAEIIGFGILILGNLVITKFIKVPCYTYEDIPQIEDGIQMDDMSAEGSERIIRSEPPNEVDA